MTRTYKKYQIVKQSVGSQGWNVFNPDGRCIKTDLSTLASAKEHITAQIEGAVCLAEGDKPTIRYEFGTYDGTVDGREFRVIASQEYDSDAQAELNAQHILDDNSGEYDLTDLDGNRIDCIIIRRGDVEWAA